MRKIQKLRIVAASILAAVLLGSAVLPTVATGSDAVGETNSAATTTNATSTAIDITGENEALTGWQYYFHNSTLGWHYQSNELFVRATTEGRTGNALEIERKKTGDELWVYSYSFDVEASTTYEISSFVKIAESSGKLVYCIKELDVNGNDVADSKRGTATQYIDRHSVSGIISDWTEESFTRTTEATTKKMVIRIRAEGTGIFNIDDIAVNKVVDANTISYKMMQIGNDGASESPATYNSVTASNLSDDAPDADGKSLHLTDHDVVMFSFGILPHGVNYRLTFKYKRVSSASSDRLSIRLDNMNPSIVRAYNADGVSGGSTTEWTSYSYDFNATSGQTDISYMRIAAYGEYLIDEVQISTLNEYLLNGSFAKDYYGKFSAGSGALTADNIASDSADGDGESLKLVAETAYTLKYSMILPKDNTYRLSFKYKKLDEAGKYITVKTDGYSIAEGNKQFWYAPNATEGKVGEWVEYSFDFRSLGNGTSDIQYVQLTASEGDFLIDDISVTCTGTFTDVQYIANGNFDGAYLSGYEFAGGSNVGFAKQSDGTFAFSSTHTTYDAGTGKRGYFHILTDMLETGKEYTLSFEYYATGSGVEVLGVYNGNASSVEKRFVSINSPVSNWTKHSATFTAGEYNQNYLEVYGTSYGRNSTFIKNIQITDADGKTYITNQTLVAPDASKTLVYSSDFGTGSAEYTWKDWTIANGGIYGFTFEDGSADYKVCLNGTKEGAASAITKEIDVSGRKIISIDKKIYYTEDSAFGSNLTITILAGDSEIAANSYGYYILPDGTEKIQVKFSTNEYVVFKKVFVAQQTPDVKMLQNGASIRTSEPYGIRWVAGVKTSDYETLVSAYGANNVKIGVIVAPLDYVDVATEFTIAAFKSASLNYADIVADTFNESASSMADGYSGFYASLVNIKEGNLNRQFAARAYIAITSGGETIYYYGDYSAENNARSIYAVSKSVVSGDAESESVKNFAASVLDKVADITIEDGAATLSTIAGYTSPYQVSLENNVLTITLTEGSSGNIGNIKIVSINGVNYAFTTDNKAITVSVAE